MSQPEGKHRLRRVSVSLQGEGCHKGLSGKPVRTGKRDRPWVLCSRPWPVSQCTEKILAVVLSREPGMTWMSVPDTVALIAASFSLPPGNEDQELETLLCFKGVWLGPHLRALWETKSQMQEYFKSYCFRTC